MAKQEKNLDSIIYEEPVALEFKPAPSDLVAYNFMILGCVSSGKSTLINSIFRKTVAETHIKRTTMVPFKYLVES
jgi:ribosome biogenesis GTPase A